MGVQGSGRGRRAAFCMGAQAGAPVIDVIRPCSTSCLYLPYPVTARAHSLGTAPFDRIPVLARPFDPRTRRPTGTSCCE